MTTKTPTELRLEDGTYGDLTVRDGKVIKGRKLVVQPFGKEVVVDVTARNSTNPQTHSFLDGVASAATALGLGVRYVPNLSGYFDPKARYAEFVKSGETSGVELSEDEKNALKLVAGIKAKFDAAFTLPEPPKAAYTKAELPGRVRNPLNGITITATRISNGAYGLPIAQVQALWNDAREFWREGKATGELPGRRFENDRYRTPSITRASVSVGCQRIRRYQLEAVATKLGWEF